jgi:hypothetical protein
MRWRMRRSLSVNLLLLVSNTSSAPVAAPVGRNTFITARTPSGWQISAYSPRLWNWRSLRKSAIARAPEPFAVGKRVLIICAVRAAGERIVLPDLRVPVPDPRDRLRLVGEKGELEHLLRTPLVVGDRLAPHHPSEASQDVRRKRRGALVGDRLQQEVQQRLAALGAHRYHPRPEKYADRPIPTTPAGTLRFALGTNSARRGGHR